MKAKNIILTLSVMSSLLLGKITSAQVAVPWDGCIPYQGNLIEGYQLANGRYDLRITVFASAVDGRTVCVGGAEVLGCPIYSGLFEVELVLDLEKVLWFPPPGMTLKTEVRPIDPMDDDRSIDYIRCIEVGSDVWRFNPN